MLDVGGGGGGLDVVVVGVSAEEDGEVGAGGEAHDADVGGVDVPVGGVGAGEAHGLLGVFEVRGVGGIVAGFAVGWGTRYLTRMQVMPMELSQWQASRPSPSQARMR